MAQEMTVMQDSSAENPKHCILRLKPRNPIVAVASYRTANLSADITLNQRKYIGIMDLRSTSIFTAHADNFRYQPEALR